MSITKEQLKIYIVGVLQKSFLNKKILDKFNENEKNELIYNGKVIVTEDTLNVIGEKLDEINRSVIT